MRRSELPISASATVNGNRSVETYGYDKPKLLWNIGVVLFTVSIAVFAAFVSVEEIVSRSYIGVRSFMLLMSILWLVISAYLLSQYIVCLYSPFAIRISSEAIELCVSKFSFPSRMEFVSFDGKLRGELKFFTYGVLFEHPIEIYCDKKSVISNGVYMLWGYVRLSGEVSENVRKFYQEMDSE